MSKNIVENFCALDIKVIKQSGILQSSLESVVDARWLNSKKRVIKTISIELVNKDLIRLVNIHKEQDFNHLIKIDRTLCNYGGSRPWFLCPACGKRVAKLYSISSYFICRSCGRLTYESTRNSKSFRLEKKLNTLLKKLNHTPLGWGDFIEEEKFQRPKGMHRKTFEKLKEEAFHLERCYEIAFCEEVKRVVNFNRS